MEEEKKSIVNSKNFNDQFKQSNANSNTNIVIKSNRLIETNSEDKFEKLKNEVYYNFTFRGILNFL